MPIASTDIIAYGSASMPDDDTPTGIGGAIDLTTRVVFTDITPAGLIEMVSSNSGDTTQTVTIYGRNTGGTLISEVQTLTGLTTVDFTSTFERILKIAMSATATGSITIRKDGAGGDLAVLEPGVTDIRRPFYNASADVSGGSAKTYFEKIFFKNNHGTLDLTTATIQEFADPSGFITFDLESTLDGTDTNGAGNRQTHTGGYTFDNTTKDVANSGSLTSGSAQGCWLQLSLAAGQAAQNTSWTARVSGATT